MTAKNHMIQSFLILILMPLSTPGFAQGVVTGTPNPLPVASPSSGPVVFPKGTPLPQPSQPSINPAANTGQASQSGGAGANNAAGAALIAAGMPLLAQPPTAPMGAMLIAMGMMALAQGSHDSNAANQSGQTAAASVNGVSPTPAATGTDGYVNPQLPQAEAALSSAGYSMTPAGLVNPDGSVTPTSAFNSAGAMAKAGIDPATIAGVQKALADVNKNAGSISGVALAEGVGGTAAKTSATAFSMPKFGSAFGLSGADKKSMIAGKTVLFDGDPVGVRGQNIFEMVHTAYQRKRDANDFIESETMASGRTPASTGPVYSAPAFKPNR